MELLDGEADEDVTAAVDRVLLKNGWPARAHVVGMIATRRTKIADGELPAALQDPPEVACPSVLAAPALGLVKCACP